MKVKANKIYNHRNTDFQIWPIFSRFRPIIGRFLPNLLFSDRIVRFAQIFPFFFLKGPFFKALFNRLKNGALDRRREGEHGHPHQGQDEVDEEV